MATASAKRRRGRRSYDNSLREEQARQTRQRIIEAVADMLADSDGDSFSMVRVAERAGVSEPTIYRHFANRETLLHAVSEWLDERMRPPSIPTELNESPANVMALYNYFAEHADVVRASVAAGPHREIREHTRPEREARLRAMVDREAAHLDERRRHALFVLVRTLVRAESYLTMTDEWDLSAAEAGEVTAFAIDAIATAIGRHRDSGREPLLDDDVYERARALRRRSDTDTDLEGEPR